MEYYRSNAIYDFISQKQLKQFRFVVGNAWQLVYGDNNCNPKLLVFAVGVSLEEIENLPSKEEIEAFELLSVIGAKTGLSVKYIRFACDVNEVDNVRVSDSSMLSPKIRTTI